MTAELDRRRRPDQRKRVAGSSPEIGATRMASFIDVDGQFINLDHVVKIAPLQGGKGRFEFADGMAQLTLTAFDPVTDLPRNEAIV
jgi:hypothetical protein